MMDVILLQYSDYKPRVTYSCLFGWRASKPDVHPSYLTVKVCTRLNAAYWWCEWRNYRDLLIQKYGADIKTKPELANTHERHRLTMLYNKLQIARAMAVRSSKDD